MSANTTELVKRAQSGDSRALNELFNSCYNDIYYFALKTVKKEDLAYDITQEACMDIFKNISSLQDPNMFVAWSKRITYNRCAQYFRKNQEILVDENEDGTDMFDSLEDDDRDFIPDEALDRDDFRKTIMNMINGLSEEQRTAVMLYYFDELSVSEIAQIQGVSEGTVKSRLNYARKSIKSAVEDYEDKNGIKLHSFGLLPLLLWLRGGDLAGLSIPAAGAGLRSALFSTASTVGASAATTTATSAATIGTTAATVAGKSIATKIIAAIVAVTVVVGGGTVAYKVMSGKSKETNVTETRGETDKKDNGTPSHKEPSREEIPTDYLSEHMEVYGSSFEYRDRISKYLTNIASYFVTADGKVYDTFDPTEPIYTAPSSDDVYCFYNCITYIDENNTLRSEFFGTDYPLENIEGEVVAVLSTGLLYNYYDVITKNNSTFYYSSYNREDLSVSIAPLPIALYDNTTQAEIGNIVNIKPCYDAIYDTDEMYVVTDTAIYLTNSIGLSEDGSTILLCGNPVAESYERLIDSNLTEDKSSPFYTKSSKDTNIYRLNGGAETSVPLPEEYTSNQVEKVITAYHTWIITFSDGSVYTYGGLYSTEYNRIDYLSDLNREGHVVDFYMEGQSLFSEDFDIILHMDDGGLYVYRG